MIAWALIIAGVIALFIYIFGLLRANLVFRSATGTQIDALGFIRLGLVGVFGVTVGQAFAPLQIHWSLAALAAVALMGFVVITSQLLSKALAAKAFATWLAKKFEPLLTSLGLFFIPLAVPQEESPEEFEQELLDSVEEFTETIVREVMVPRIDLATVSASATLDQALETFLKSGFSRLPVIGKNIDDVVGVLYLKDLALKFSSDPQSLETVAASAIMRLAVFVPESKPVDDLLREMQQSATHIAIIVDEYGGVSGIATMEDVLEEIVGDISDEYDQEVEDFKLLPNGSYRVNAKCSLFDLGEELGLELEDEDVDTVGGLLTKQLGRLPNLKDEVTVSGLRMKVEKIEGRRKRLVSIIVEKTQEYDDMTQALSAKESAND
ncbi:MAG: hypothetical protein RI933_1331 [Actinomycetota bacterium]|jgi:CBS domain containing-hemolysin-like protein